MEKEQNSIQEFQNVKLHISNNQENSDQVCETPVALESLLKVVYKIRYSA